MYTVEYLSLALDDLKEIAKYIAEKLGNPKAALSLVKEITAAVEKAREFPYSQSLYTPLRPLSHEYRKLVVNHYLVFYWVSDSTRVITVARVLYNRRNSATCLNDKQAAKNYR